MSRGDGCASKAGIYTDVAAYRDWIEEQAGPSCEDAEDWHKTDDPDNSVRRASKIPRIEEFHERPLATAGKHPNVEHGRERLV